MRCRYVIKKNGRRVMRCSFLNNERMELHDEKIDSMMDESDEETEVDYDDEGEGKAAKIPLGTVSRAGASVVENVEAVEMVEGGGVPRVVLLSLERFLFLLCGLWWACDGMVEGMMESRVCALCTFIA